MSDMMTIEKLKAAMSLAPKPIGYAVLTANSYLEDQCYRIKGDNVAGDALYWLVVPRGLLSEVVESLHAYPSDDFPGDSYRFSVYSLLEGDIG